MVMLNTKKEKQAYIESVSHDNFCKTHTQIERGKCKVPAHARKDRTAASQSVSNLAKSLEDV
jgi:hypothetical protein